MRAASPRVKLTYERTGVDEYWVVDPTVDVIRVFRGSGEKFDRPVELSAEAGDTLTTTLLPGLEIHLARVFALTDEQRRGAGCIGGRMPP